MLDGKTVAKTVNTCKRITYFFFKIDDICVFQNRKGQFLTWWKVILRSEICSE